MSQYLTIDVGGTAIKYALMDEAATYLGTGETPTLRGSMEEFLEALDTVILPHKDEVAGIAFSMPGRIDIDRGFAYTGGALSNFIHNTPVKEILEDRYNLPVWIENDGKCAALAEAWLGNLNDVQSGVVVILGTGIGGGIVLNRKVWRGMNGSAGELSGLPVDYTKGAEKSTMWAYLNGYGGLTAPYAAKKGLDRKAVDGRKFFDAYHQGDPDAKEVFDYFIQTLTAGIITCQAILDVDKYCIGGGISAQDVLIDAAKESVHHYFKVNEGKTAFNEPKVDRCLFRNDANLIGALRNFLDQQKKTV